MHWFWEKTDPWLIMSHHLTITIHVLIWEFHKWFWTGICHPFDNSSTTIINCDVQRQKLFIRFCAVKNIPKFKIHLLPFSTWFYFSSNTIKYTNIEICLFDLSKCKTQNIIFARYTDKYFSLLFLRKYINSIIDGNEISDIFLVWLIYQQSNDMEKSYQLWTIYSHNENKAHYMFNLNISFTVIFDWPRSQDFSSQCIINKHDLIFRGL